MLPEPVTRAGRVALAALLADPAAAVVALDFDGTLAPIVAVPEEARPAPGAVAAVAALAARVGTCALISGRAAETVVQLGGFGGVARLTVLGHYGLQRWHGGRLSSPAPEPGVAAARAALPGVLAGAADGVHVEDKAHSLVVHTRRTADPARVLTDLRPALAALAAAHGLELVPGRFVLELRPPGVDKGAALVGLVGDRLPSVVLFVGDDLGDLPAFDAVERLRARGVPGLLVASGSAEVDELATRADLVLDGPPAVVDFLTRLAAAIGDVG